MRTVAMAAVAVGLGIGVMLSGCNKAANADDTSPAPAASSAPAAPAAEPAAAGKAPVAFDAPPPVGAKATCPVMKAEFVVTASTERSTHKGKHYAFCCPGCKPQFDADPAKFAGE